MMTHGDLFSGGCAGFSLAAKRQEIKTLWACENDKKRQKFIKLNFPDLKIYDDIRNMINEKIKPVSIISAGLPCQPFSRAGKKRGVDDDRYLWPETFSIIKRIKPDWIVLENVPDFSRLALDSIYIDLEKANYSCQAFNIPAAGVGAPFFRERIWIVGAYNAHPDTFKIRSPRRSSAKSDKKNKNGICAPDVQALTYSTEDSIQQFNREYRSPFLAENHGLFNRLAAIEAIGDAIVPQIAEEIFYFIKQVNKIFGVDKNG